MSEPRRALIDPEVCVGSGACEMEDPDYFQVLDDGNGHVVGPLGQLDEARLVHIADACPARAISVADASGQAVWKP